MKITSIKFRLISGGIILVLLPLLIVGFLAISKSSTALTDLSKSQAENIALDLAGLADNILAEELKLAEVIAEQNQVANTLSTVQRLGIVGAGQQIDALHQELAKTFAKMGTNYQGIYVSDAAGNIFTGVLDGGAEYKGISIAEAPGFLKAKATGKANIADPTRSKATGKIVSAISVPVKSDSWEFIGTLGVVVKVEFLTDLISGRKIGKTGYGFMTDQNGLVLAHPITENILKLNMSELVGMETFVQKMLSGKSGVEEYTFKGIDKIAGSAPLSVANWYIATTQDAAEFLNTAHSIRNWSLGVILVAVILTVIAVAFSAGLIVNPLNKAIASLKDIAEGEGDLTMRLDARSKDEIGELGFWFNTFVEKLQGIIKRIAENSNIVNTSSSQLSLIAKELSSGAVDTSQRSANVATASEEMSANLNNVAAAMEQSSTNVNMVASAAEEMTSTINEIAENAERARSVSGNAVGQAKSASEKMEELGEAARRIGKVTETITEISEQTNLLALNATIEAARAGEAGRGFAVVANEIKDLAKQTAEATLHIKDQINDVQQTTEASIGEINQISEVISGVNDIVATIAAAVEEQTAATKEIANNIAQASQGIQEVNENVSQSSTVAGDITEDISKVNLAATGISESSKQVQTSSEDLGSLAQELHAIVSSFKV